MIMLGALLLAGVANGLPAQTSEDAHVQHMGELADAALNEQYRRTMATMAQADRERDADLKKGDVRPDNHPTYQVALRTAQRAWLVYRDAHCETIGLGYRGGVYEDEADGKCVNELTRKRTVELKQVSDNMSH